MEEEVLLFGEAKAETVTFLTDIAIVTKPPIEVIYPILELETVKAPDMMTKETILLLEITKTPEAKQYNQEEIKHIVEVILHKAQEALNRV